jgi:hypothetical protein
VPGREAVGADTLVPQRDERAEQTARAQLRAEDGEAPVGPVRLWREIDLLMPGVAFET